MILDISCSARIDTTLCSVLIVLDSILLVFIFKFSNAAWGFLFKKKKFAGSMDGSGMGKEAKIRHER